MPVPPIALPAVLLLLLACGGDDGPTPPPPPPPPPPPVDGGPVPRLAFAPAGALPDVVLFGRSMEATAADLDGDGDLDLVVAREFERSRLLLNDGTARFTDATDGRLPDVVRDSEDVAAADLDGDGDLDLVIVAEDDVPGQGDGPKHQLLLNDGTGRFADASDRLPVRSDANAVAAGDVDGDGDRDLVLGNAGQELLLLNDGTGRFTDATAGRLPEDADVTQDVVLGDVDRDGDLDLVVAVEDGGPNRLLLNDGSGTFTAAALPLRASLERSRNADLGDVDGDGDPDLVFANVNFGGGDPQARLLLNDGRGTFTDVTAERLGSTPSLIDLEFADLDGEGDLDLLGAPFPAGALRAWINDGTRFTSQGARIFPDGLVAQVIEVEARDFDGDGRMDVYYATFVESPDLLLLGQP